jgi:hypothetical protein
MTKTLQSKMEKLQKKFPGIWMKDGGDFSSGYEGTIWSGEGSYIGEESAFNMYNDNYIFGVHPKLEKALDAVGLYAQAHDAGTFFFYTK